MSEPTSRRRGRPPKEKTSQPQPTQLTQTGQSISDGGYSLKIYLHGKDLMFCYDDLFSSLGLNHNIIYSKLINALKCNTMSAVKISRLEERQVWSYWGQLKHLPKAIRLLKEIWPPNSGEAQNFLQSLERYDRCGHFKSAPVWFHPAY